MLKINDEKMLIKDKENISELEQLHLRKREALK